MLPITLLCVRGNHEMRPEDAGVPWIEYSEKFDGSVYCDKNYPNIYYAVDGGEYRIEGLSILTIGGAYSVDKYYRLINHWYWNPKEQLSNDERNYIEKKIRDNHYDYVLTHTCPFTWQPRDLFLGMIDQNTVDNTMENWLERVSREIEYDHWMFGHFHANRYDMLKDGKVTMLFNDYVEITNNDDWIHKRESQQ